MNRRMILSDRCEIRQTLRLVARSVMRELPTRRSQELLEDPSTHLRRRSLYTLMRRDRRAPAVVASPVDDYTNHRQNAEQAVVTADRPDDVRRA